MKATLIKLDTKVVDIPDYRPVWRELVKPDGLALEANYEGMNQSFMPYELKTVDYRVVRIAGGKNEENGYYLVNDEMWFVAMPLIRDIVDSNRRELEHMVEELKILTTHLDKVKTDYESTWYIRLKNYAKKTKLSFIKKLAGRTE